MVISETASSLMPLPLGEQVELVEHYELDTLLFCPDAWALRHRFVNTETGETIRARCGSWSCLYCGPRKVDMWRQLVKAAEPTLFVTLTQVGKTLQEASRVLTTVLQYIRRGSKGCGKSRLEARPAYPIQVFAVLEEHSDFELVGFHWHLLVKGVDFLPNQVVSDALRSATKGRSYITKVVRVRNNTAVGYVTKYLTKEIMREYRGVEQEQHMVPMVAQDVVPHSQDQRGEVYEYKIRRDGEQRVVEVREVQVVERLCKAHRIRYSRSFFPEPTADLRRRLFGQVEDEVTDERVEAEGTRAEEGEAPALQELGEVENADRGDQPTVQVPCGEHSARSEEFQETSTSGGLSEALPVHWSVWVLHESDPFSEDRGEYKRRRRRALAESLLALREGRRLYSRRVVGIWAYQRDRLKRVA
jgi:hypothetical protein